MEVIGGVSIEIQGDYSGLQEDLDAAQSLAASAATKIADALDIATPDTAPVTQSLQQISDAAASTGQSIASALDVQVAALDVSPVIDSFTALTDSAKATGNAVKDIFSGGLDTGAIADAIEPIWEDLKKLEDEFVAAGGAVADLSGPMAEAASAIQGVGASAIDGQGALQVIIDKLKDGEIGGREFISMANALTDALEAAGAKAVEVGPEFDGAANGEKTFSDGAQAIIDKQQSLDTALASSISALGEIHNAFADGAVTADTLARAEDAVVAAIQAAGSAVNQAADQVKQYSDAAQSTIDAQKRLDDELKVSAGALAEIYAAYASGAVSAETLARAQRELADAANAAAPAIKETGSAAQEASSGFGDLATQLLALAGISLTIESLVELGKAAIDASDHLDDAAYAIGRLNQGAMSGKEEIAGLLAVAQDEGLSFPGLVTAAQHMETLGIHGQDVIDTLRALGNASELTGGSIDSMAQKFATLSEGTSASAMSLKRIGLTVDEVKESMIDMGANADQVNSHWQQLWKVMDETQHADVLRGALENLDGAAKAMNDDIKGDVQRTMNEFYVAIGKLGDVIAPLAQQALPYLVDALKVLVVAADASITSFKVLLDVLVGYAGALKDVYAGLAAAGSAIAKADFSGAASAVTSAIDRIKTDMSDMSTKIQSDIKAGADFAKQAWGIDMPAALDKTKAAAKDTSNELAGLALKSKDASASIASAFAAVADFESKLSSDSGVSKLQADFENASKAINTVAKIDLPAAIKAVDDYTAAQIRNGAGASVIMQAFQEFSKLVGQLAKIDLPAASAAMTDYLGKLISAKEPIGIIQAALEQEEKMLQQLAKQDLQAAADGWDKLIQKLRDTNAPAQILTQALQDHMKFLDGVAAAAEKAATAMGKMAVAYSDFNTKGAPVTQVFKDAAAAVQSLVDTLPKVPPAISPTNQAMIDFGVGVGKAKDAVQNLHTPIDQLVADMGRLVAAAKDSGDWSAFTKALEEFDKRIQEIAKTDLPEAAKQMEAWIQGMINAGAPTQQVQQQLSLLEPILKKMAEQDLPGAASAWQKYLDLLKQVPSAVKDIQQAQAEQLQQDLQILSSMQQRGDAYGYILEQQKKVMQEEISLAEKTGEDANAQVLGLEKVKLAQQELALQSHGLADQEVKMINDIISGFDQMGSVMSDAIVNGKNLGDALIGQFKKIGQSILTDIINIALLPLKMALFELIGTLLPGMSGAMGIVGGGLGTMNAAAGNAASGLTALAQAANTAAASINTSVNGAGADTSGKGGVGGIGSTVGMIAQVVSAAAAVASAILLAHISSDTGHIEVNTRSCLAEALNLRADSWSQFGTTYNRLGEIKNALDKSVDLLAQLKITTGNGLVPADSAALQSVNKILTDNEHFQLVELQAIDASTQYINAGVQTVHNDLYLGFITMHEDIFLVVGVIQTLTSALLYGGHSSQSYSASSEIMQASEGVESAIQSASAQSHAQLSQIDSSIQNGTASGRQNNQLTNADLAQKYAQQLAASQAQYDAAMSIAGEVAALRDQMQADQALANLAYKDGNVALGDQYMRAAQQLGNQITPLLGTINSTVSSKMNTLNTSIVNGSTDVAMSATNAGVLVSTAVGQSAVQISNAVINSAGASAALFNTGVSSLIGLVGALGKVGGGANTQQYGNVYLGAPGLPSGSGLGNTNPNGTATYTNPGIPVGQQAGFNPNSPATGGMTQAQWEATGHASQAPDWWLKGLPQPGINQGNLPKFDTGGMVQLGGLAFVDTGELILPEDLSAAVKAGETVVSSPKLTGASNVLFTEPNKQDLSSADKGFVDHGESTDPDAWKQLANQVKGVGDSIAAQDKARATVADQMTIYQAEISHAQKLLADATQAGDKTKIALAQQYVNLMIKLIDSTVPATGPKDKTPVQDPNFQPATSDQAKQIAVLQQQANDAQAQLIAANKSGDAAKIQAAQQQVSIAVAALSAAQAQAQYAMQLTAINQSIAADQVALVQAQMSGDASKIAIAQQVLATDQALLVSAMAQQQSAATSAAVAPLPGIEITKVGQQLSLQLTAINLQLISAQANLSAAFQSGDAQKIALAQQQVDVIKQLLAAVMAGSQGGAQQQGPSQQDLLAASMAWLDAQQGITAEQKAISTATFQADAKAGLLPSPKASGSDFSGYNPYSTPTGPQAASLPSGSIPSGPANKTPLIDPTFVQPYGPANKTPVQDIPSFDVGGFIGRDMLAMVHAGEWVIPNAGKVALPPEVMARIQMPNIPGAPNVPNVPFSTGSSGGTGDSFTFNIYGITDPDMLMREISSRVKTRTGRTAKFSN